MDRASLDTSPLRCGGFIVEDDAQRRLDSARAVYRRQYDKGYSLSERGESDRAQRILDQANAALRQAEFGYARSRGRV
jgi:hypothetical protein